VGHKTPSEGERKMKEVVLYCKGQSLTYLEKKPWKGRQKNDRKQLRRRQLEIIKMKEGGNHGGRKRGWQPKTFSQRSKKSDSKTADKLGDQTERGGGTQLGPDGGWGRKGD